MKTNLDLNKMIEYPKQGIISKQLEDFGEKLETTLFCMAKGTKIGNHTSTKEGIVYVLEGDGIFTLEKKEIKMEKGVIISLKNNALHSLSAKENTSFILILS